ncbi:MAG: hypothetical protein ACYDG2_14860 [Ruminiclostridium sp.]
MLDNKNKKFEGYFAMLPAHVQETLMQSGVDWSSENELHEIVANLMKKD